MDGLLHFSHAGYQFGTRRPLTTSQLDHLIRTFQAPGQAAVHALGGRCAPPKIQLEGIGAVIVKHYCRGGLLAHIIAETYVKTAKTRCQTEFEQMEKVRKMGVSAPEPIAYAYQGRFLYRAWLVTREIERCQSVAELSRTAPERIPAVMAHVVEHINILVENEILHGDFHPGNVLIDDRDRIYIVDLDKSGAYRTGKEKLALKYRRRWVRAVKKHRLSPLLLNPMEINTP